MATTFRLKRATQKIFMLLDNGEGKSLMDFKKEWTAGGGEAKLGKFTDWYKGDKTGLAATNSQNAANEAARAAQRAANKANPGAAAAKAAYQRGAASTGILGGIKNTWKSGAGGRAGLIAGGAALLGTGLLAGKSLFGGKKEEN